MNDAAGRRPVPATATKPSSTRPPAAPAPAPAPPPVAAPAPAAASASAPGAEVPADPVELWNRTVEYAGEHTSDHALIRELQLEGGGDGALTLRLLDGRTSTARFIESNLDRIQKIVERATGVRATVELAPTPGRSEPEDSTARDRAIAENPVVRKAVELFDATIHSVRPLPGPPPESADSDSSAPIGD